MPLFFKRNKAPLGIYIHVPFCRSKCHYCDFYSLPCKERNEELMDRYVKAVCAHIKETGPLAPGYKVDTIYFGGGTPSHLGSAGLSSILAEIRRSFDVDNNAEITFEANPDSVAIKLLQRLRKAGFDNISVDLMYGLPQQSPFTWRDTLQNVLSLHPEHVSCYGLKVEEGTPCTATRTPPSCPPTTPRWICTWPPARS